MNTYQLQARMKDGTFINLDFLNSYLEGNRLVDIDKFTNAYSYWDFLSVVEPYLTEIKVEEIDSFVIAIRGKNIIILFVLKIHTYLHFFKNQL